MSKTLASTLRPKPKSASVSGSDVTTTSATAVDITGLSIAVGASKRYKLVATLFIGCNNTGGVRFAWNGPSGSALLSGIITGSGATNTSPLNNRVPTTAGTLSNSGAAYNRYNGATGMVQIIAFFTTSSTTGNITLQFGSTNAGETSTVFIGSTFDLTEVQ